MSDYNITKQMLETIREKTRIFTEQKISKELLFEQTEEQGQQEPTQQQPDNDDVTNINDVDVRIISDSGYEREVSDNMKMEITGLIDSFREQVSQIAELNPGITIKDEQIRIDGVLNDTNLKFVLIGGQESGIYISSEMSNLNADTVLFLTKLQKFEQTFKDVVEPLIRERNGN